MLLSYRLKTIYWVSMYFHTMKINNKMHLVTLEPCAPLQTRLVLGLLHATEPAPAGDHP